MAGSASHSLWYYSATNNVSGKSSSYLGNEHRVLAIKLVLFFVVVVASLNRVIE